MIPSFNIRRPIETRPLIDATDSILRDIRTIKRIANKLSEGGDDVSAGLLDQVVCRLESEEEFNTQHPRSQS